MRYYDPDITIPDQDTFMKGEAFKRSLASILQFEINIQVILTEKDLAEMLGILTRASIIQLQLFTTNTSKLNNSVVGYIFTYLTVTPQGKEELFSYYIPVKHRTDQEQLDKQKVQVAVQQLLEVRELVWMVWDSKQVIHGLENMGLTVPQWVRWFDGQLIHKILYPESKIIATLMDWLQGMGSQDIRSIILGLKDYLQLLCSANGWPIRGGVWGRTYYEYVPIQILAIYAAFLAIVLYTAIDQLKEDISKSGPWMAEQDYQSIAKELVLAPILYEMERTGIYFDFRAAYKFRQDMAARLSELSEIMQGYENLPNWRSPQQIVDFLNTQVLPSRKHGPPIVPVQNVNEGTLLCLKEHGVPEAEAILEIRHIDSLLSRVDGLEQLVEKDGGVHTTFSISGTETGRITSFDPDLQNIPIHGKWAPEFRKILAIPRRYADQGWVWIFADLSQIELRVLAALSKDPVLLKAYQEGGDIHTETARMLFTEKWEGASSGEKKIYRSVGKTVNFGIVYGIGEEGLSAQLAKAGIHVSKAECLRYLEWFKRYYVGVWEWRLDILRQLFSMGFVQTAYGRIRMAPDCQRAIISNSRKRELVNFVIQGSAADLYKSRLYGSNVQLRSAGIRFRWIHSIYDEVQYVVHPEDLDQSIQIVREEFTKPDETIQIPLGLDFFISKSHWGAKEAYA